MSVSIASGVVAVAPKQLVAGTNVSIVETATTSTINVTGGGGGSATVYTVSLDLGSVPVYSKQIDFTDANITALSKVIMSPSGTSDELEMDNFCCAVKCGSGTATAYITAVPGPVTGTRTFNYTIG
jgi:hypothetical protein